MAERTRKLREQHERYLGRCQQHMQQKASYEASLSREARLVALREARDQLRAQIDAKGQEGKAEGDDMRRRHNAIRETRNAKEPVNEIIFISFTMKSSFVLTTCTNTPPSSSICILKCTKYNE